MLGHFFTLLVITHLFLMLIYYKNSACSVSVLCSCVGEQEQPLATATTFPPS